MYSLYNARTKICPVHCTICTVYFTLIPTLCTVHIGARGKKAHIQALICVLVCFPNSYVCSYVLNYSYLHSYVVPNLYVCAYVCSYVCSYVLNNSYLHSYVVPNLYMYARMCSQTCVCASMCSLVDCFPAKQRGLRSTPQSDLLMHILS